MNNPGKNKNKAEQHLNRWCALPSPYPEIKVLRPNRYYAGLLLEDYAGRVSEMTAISQYFHHHVVLEGQYSQLAELEECVSIIEMWHLEMLGETIRLLGVDPQLYAPVDGRRVYWQAGYVYYGSEVCDRLAADIAAEEAAIRQYRQHQQMIKDPYIDALLERIIMDEQHHLRLFTEALEKYCKLR